MTAPPHFEAAKEAAASTWATLESSPELAGPWHRLFQQVQSPRHVLSELLQNADDADATWASASVEDGAFVFCHNGRDFSSDEFGSICRFGYSNKRALHTIGFRGVGFKSAFSLGDEVRLITPTLQVAFLKHRFTEPVWTELSPQPEKLTRIEVRLRDGGVERELRKNLGDWLASPASLLFFRRIRSLQIAGKELKWLEVGPGPVSNSQWLNLEGAEAKPYLLIRSNAEPFPEAALAEIESERNPGGGEQLDLPPCTVDILLGDERRLFVVLPTGVKTQLPFAINAPFVQDPARLKVKDPDSSPTNKWLLERAGGLAVEAMLGWLKNQSATPVQRAEAYELMPDIDREDSSLEGSCAATTEIAFDTWLDDKAFVLAEGGQIVGRGAALVISPAILDVWTATESSRLFCPEGKQIASRAITSENTTKLQNWQAVSTLSRAETLERLKNGEPTKPQSWNQLLQLWSYLADDIPAYHWHGNDLRGFCIAPVRGESRLQAASSVVRLGEKKLLTSEADWSFLSTYLRVLNPNWGRFLADQRKLAEERNDSTISGQIERAYKLLRHLQLEDSSDTNLVVRRVATSFFAQESIPISDCVRVAQIAARLGAAVASEFKFVTQDDVATEVEFGVIADEGGVVEDLVPESWAHQHLLHFEYWKDWQSCSRDEWLDWIGSGRSGLTTGPPLTSITKTHWSRKQLDSDLNRRGFEGKYEPHYKTEHFELHDSDFEAALWEHWMEGAKEDEGLWARVLDLVLDQRPNFWDKHLEARVQHVATTGSKRQVAGDGIPASWILKLRELPCLRDTRGFTRKPFEVLRRTPQTEALLEVEPFIPAQVDSEGNRPLFNALKVRNFPSGPEHVLQRIQALAEAEEPPVDELDKWYRKLDSLLQSCSTDDAATVRDSFESEPLIYSANDGWAKSGEVFISASEDDMPDAPVIRTSVQDLELWRRVGVADRPNFGLILAWLQEIPTGESLPPDISKRVKTALARFAESIWSSCGHWLNLAGQWVPIERLTFSLSLRTLTKSQDLFPSIRESTADFQMLSHEQQDRNIFAALPSLASCIEERLADERVRGFEPIEKPWLTSLGTTLARIVLASEAETERVQNLAVRLSRTTWHQGRGLQTIPYLDGVPVGPPRLVPAVWSETKLYVEDGQLAGLAAPVSREIGRAFDSPTIGDAIKFSFERDPEFITSFLAREFSLGTPTIVNESDLDQAPTPSQEPENSVPSTEGGTTSNAVEGPRDESVQEVPPPTDHSPQSPQSESRRESPNQLDDRPRPQRPSLIERFATQEGFSKNGDGLYKASDGRRLIRSEGSLFPWEVRDGSGTLIHALLPQEHCLETEPIMIEAEAWSLLRSSESTYCLLLLAPDASPKILTGGEVGREITEKRIVLYPAKYRLTRVD